MKKKNIFKILFAMMLCLCLSFSFVACTPDDDGGDEPPQIDHKQALISICQQIDNECDTMQIASAGETKDIFVGGDNYSEALKIKTLNSIVKAAIESDKIEFGKSYYIASEGLNLGFQIIYDQNKNAYCVYFYLRDPYDQNGDIVSMGCIQILLNNEQKATQFMFFITENADFSKISEDAFVMDFSSNKEYHVDATLGQNAINSYFSSYKTKIVNWIESKGEDVVISTSELEEMLGQQ